MALLDGMEKYPGMKESPSRKGGGLFCLKFI